MLPEPIAVTFEVIDALDVLEVPYFIGGSLASAVHGTIRSTLDADLVADLRQSTLYRWPRPWQIDSTSMSRWTKRRLSGRAAST